MTGKTATKSSSVSPPAEHALVPDTAILIEARIKSGERNVQMKAISNLILHDPVLTIEFLHFANSIMYAGTSVIDVEGAVTRLGTKRLITVLAELNAVTPPYADEILEAFEILRYNCRRFSIVSLIIAGVLRPNLVGVARTAGLFSDVGHMLALSQLGTKYTECARAHRRQTLPFRLEKDHKFNLNKQLVKYLTAKSVPRVLVVPYDLDEQPKGGVESDLRHIVQSAREIIEAYDGGKIGNYDPKKQLPANSALRVLKINTGQLERIFKACTDYLKLAAEEEAPEGASLLISSVEGEDLQTSEESEETPADSLLVPKYPNLSVKPKSREALKQFFELCERERNELELRKLAVEYLRKSGLFERTALLRVSADGKKVVVEHSFGLDVGPGDVVRCSEPDSPFKMLQVELRSAKISTEHAPAPFGTTAYGLGPVDLLPTGDKLALYIDRSVDGGLTMESRRVFRLVLGLLTQSLVSARSESPTA